MIESFIQICRRQRTPDCDRLQMTKILFHYCGLFNDVIVVGVIVGAVVAKVLGVAVVETVTLVVV